MGIDQDAKFGQNAGHHDSTQPKPSQSIDSRSVTDELVSDLLTRREQGIKKYGTELMSHNGRDALLDAYQEVLDTAVYLKQALMERDAAK